MKTYVINGKYETGEYETDRFIIKSWFGKDKQTGMDFLFNLYCLDEQVQLGRDLDEALADFAEWYERFAFQDAHALHHNLTCQHEEMMRQLTSSIIHAQLSEALGLAPNPPATPRTKRRAM